MSIILQLQILKNMTEKQTTNKQQRHQFAKTKYQHYHRVLSCKNLMKNVAPINPSPGQFLVQNQKSFDLPQLAESRSYSILLTKNIKSIVQKPNPVPFGEMLNEVVTKKSLKLSGNTIQLKKQNEKNEIQPYFRRPISAKIYQQTEGKQIQDSQILRHAIEYDRKSRKKQETLRKNYFQVKPKLKIPKHIHGYNTIILKDKNQEFNRISEQMLENEVQTKLSSINTQFEKSFLPTEYYLQDSLKPQELIEKYKHSDGIIFGFSRWFHSDGSHSWKRCRILRYIPLQQRWEIQWLCSGISKKVSRNNLYFESQNFEQFEKAVQLAEQFKRKSQIYMKYNILINLINNPTPNLSLESQNKIKSLINVPFSEEQPKNQFLVSFRNQLMGDVQKLYERSCHQFQFNLMLPYSVSLKKIFGGVLPDQMFDANPRKMMENQSEQIEKTKKQNCNHLFSSGLKKLKEKSFLNSEKKIKIFQLINIINEQLGHINLLKNYKKLQSKCYTITDLNTIINRNISEYFYKINCRICDIEHHVSKELDSFYANKKFIPEDQYNNIISRYRSFLLLVNMKIQACLRQSLVQIIKKLIQSLPTSDTQKKSDSQSNQIDWSLIYLQKRIDLKIQLLTSIKQGKLQTTPNQRQFSQVILRNVQNLLFQLKKIKCVSKSYIPQVRPDNLLKVLEMNIEDATKNEEISLINQTVAELKEKLQAIDRNLLKFTGSLSKNIEEIFKNNLEIQRKFQKKNSYGEIEEIIQKINDSQRQIGKLIKIKQFDLCGIFTVNFEDIKIKASIKITETMKQVVNILIEKIHKDNEKMDKNVATMLQNMQKVPTTITQFVELQKYVNEDVKEQIQKTHYRAKMLTQKMNLLQKTSQIIQYRQFQSCCQIYLKPLKLKKFREETLFKLQNIYKKNFAEQLMKDSYTVLDNIKNCEKLFSQSLNYHTLDKMDKNFHVFSQLHEEIESSCHRMMNINEKQNLLKWSKTNFDRLLEVKQQFEPYYKLITLHKNYRMKLVPLLEQTFSQINYQAISSNVASSFDTLKFLQSNKFHQNLTYEPIIETILSEYEQFSKNLPLIKSLRNPDLRERHWIIIQNITDVHHIRNEQITLRQIVLNQNIRNQQSELHKISQIASKQLIYEKSLNQLKRQWKDVRVSIKETKIGNQLFKFIVNIGEIQKKLENDILQVNNILSSSFIKFLQADVSHWKSSILQKIYEFVNYWPNFESKVIFYLRLVNSNKISQIFLNSNQVQKNFQKLWKQFMGNIQFQSLIVDIVNIRTWESMNSLSVQIDEIQKIVSQYLEQKKKANSKLRLFSDDALTSMMVEPNSELALSSIKKCFNGVKSMKILQQPTEQGHQNIQILSTLDQKIVLVIEDSNRSGQKCSTNNLESNQLSSRQLSNKSTYQFDELLLTIDKQLKKQIKSTFLNSLKKQITQNDLLCQVQLLRTRLIFKNMLEKNMRESSTLDGYQLQIVSQQRQNISKMKKVKNNKNIKILSIHVLQCINQLNIVKKLNNIENPIESFQWFKYPKYEMADVNNSSNSKLKFIVGNNSREYQFELIQCQNFLINPFNDAVFLNICTSISDRMLVLMQGSPGSSKSITIQYLGQLMGRNVTEISCSNATSPSNLLQYLKIASSGLILVLEELDKLSKQCLSAFDQCISIFWMNYQLSRTNINAFKINSEELILDIPNFALFGLSSSISSIKFSNMSSLKQCFRTFNIFPISFKYLLQCALMSVGLAFSINIDLSFIQCAIQELNFHKIEGNVIGINKNIFVWQIARKFQQLYQFSIRNQQNEKVIPILHQSLQKVLQGYIPEQNHKIWKDLSELKIIGKKKGPVFTKIKIEQNKSQAPVSELNEKFNEMEQFKKNIQTIKSLLHFHPGVIVTGPKISGKTSLVNYLSLENKQKKKYNISSINPLAYTIEQLYQGDIQTKGIIRQLVEELKIKATALQLNNQVTNALHFDSDIGYWADPLLQIVNKPQSCKISCPDGSLVTLPTPIKIIFQTQTLKNMSPNNFHSIGLLSLTQEVNWKRLFCHLFQKYFCNIEKSANAQFIRQLFEQSFDSVIDFYQSIFKQKTHRNSQFLIVSKLAILKSLLHFFSIIYHKEDIETIQLISQQQNQVQGQGQGQSQSQGQAQKQNEQKIKSQIFNIYIYSVVGTLGLLIPDESRKTFSRHFKYVLQQTHLCRYGWKKSNILNNQQLNVYQFYYEHGEWKKCRKQKSVLPQNILFLDQYKFLEKVLIHHAQSGTPCFIVGQECSSKNYLFKNLINNLQTQKYTKNFFVCSSLTNKSGICKKIGEMIQTQKYSRKINGFSNCKKNLIYIQDLNMTLLNQEKQQNGSIVEFIKQFYRKKSCYIDNTLYGFGNLQFYGTLNKSLPIPNKIYKFINPVLMNCPQKRVQSILEAQISASPISSREQSLIVRCTLNLQDIIIRDLSQQTILSGGKQLFNLRDMMRIVSGVCKITSNFSTQITIHTLLRQWVYLAEKVYSQKISQQKKGFLFYLINNVLMEEQRLRYRTICPNSDFYILNIGEQKQLNSIQTRRQYKAYNLQSLSDKIKEMAESNSVNEMKKNKNALKLFIDQNCDEILKLMAKIINSFDFESKIILICNEQRRRLRCILELVALANKSWVFESQTYNISSPSGEYDWKIQKKFNQQFTKAYLQVFDHNIPLIESNQRTSSPFQSQMQTKKLIQNEQYEKALQNTKQKNKIIIHLSNEQLDETGDNKTCNFILEDLLAFTKLNRYPKWLIPKQQIYDDIPELTQKSIFSKKNTGLGRFLSNKQAHQIIKEQYEKQFLSKSVDINVILQYKKLPKYVTSNYKNLIGEASLIFLANSQVEPSQISKSNKIIMTQIMCEDEMDDEIDQVTQEKICSGKNIGRLINKFGLRFYTDLFYNIFMGYLNQRWFCNVRQRDTAFKYSFRNIFNNFLEKKKQRQARRSKIQSKIEKTLNTLIGIKNKMEQRKKQVIFIESQNSLRLSQVVSKLQKQQQKYTIEKKKIEQMRQKIEKKQRQYEENLKSYRMAMDKYSFEYSKTKEKLIKIMSQFETNKLNINNALTNDNKLMIQIFSCIIYIADFKKNQDISMLALRQFMKHLKEKKISKLLQKTTIENIPSKFLHRMEKIVHQLEHIGHKTIELISTNKKIQQVPQQADQNTLLKSNLYQFLSICLISCTQFNSPNVKQFYDSIQNASKTGQKIKSDLSKKQKNKVLKQLFQSYEALVEQKSQLLIKRDQVQKQLFQVTQTLDYTNKSITLHIESLRQKSKQQYEKIEENQSSAYLMCICVRFFNQMYSLTKEQIIRVFSYLKKHFQVIQAQLTEPLDRFASDWSKVQQIKQSIVLDSTYLYRGFILVQLESSPCSPSQQSYETVNDLLYRDRKIKHLTLEELLRTTKLELVNYDGIKIQVNDHFSEGEIKQKAQYLDMVEKIINFKISEQKLKEFKTLPNEILRQKYWEKPIFIQSTYFSEQQKSNFPYINFTQITKTKQNNEQIQENDRNCARLTYDYVYKKCKQKLFENEVNSNFHLEIPAQSQKQLENKKQVQDQLEMFMLLHLPSEEQGMTIDKTILYCQKLDAIFTQQNLQPHKQTQTLKQNMEDQESKQDHMTDKQKQKMFVQNKICQFFAKYYIICQSAWANSLGEPISLGYYLENVNKLVKNLSTSTSFSITNVTPSHNSHSNSTLPIYQIVNSPESTIYRYLYKLRRQLLPYIPKIQNYFLLALCNARLQIFGNQSCYQKYIQIFIKELSFRLKSQNKIENANKVQGKNEEVSTKQLKNQAQKQKKQAIKNELQKLSANIPNFQNTLCVDVLNDYEFWQQDVQNMYKQEKQPPIQWYSLLLIYDFDRFIKFIEGFQTKLASKYSASDEHQMFDYVPAQDRLSLLIPSPSTKISNGNHHNIYPIFLSTSHRYHDIVKFLQEHKQEYEFIDVRKFLEKNDPRGHHSPAESQKSHNANSQKSLSNKNKKDIKDIEMYLDSSKVYLTFVKNDKDLQLLQYFIIALQKKLESKSMKSTLQQVGDIKIIILTQKNWHYSSSSSQSQSLLKNSLKFKQKYKIKQESLLKSYHMMRRFYLNNLKDKMKVKDYELLPNKIKRIIYEVFLSVKEGVVSLPYSNVLDQDDGYRMCDMVTRSIDYVEKLLKLIKLNRNNINGSINTNTLEYFSNWKCFISQIIFQSHWCSSEQIKSIFTKSIDQSQEIVDQRSTLSSSQAQPQLQNKILMMVSQSQTHKKLKKILTSYNIKNIRGKLTTGTFSNNLSELYEKIYKQMRTLQQLQGSPKNSSHSSSRNAIQITDLMYLVCRKESISSSLPISQIKSRITLESEVKSRGTKIKENKMEIMISCRIKKSLKLQFQTQFQSYALKIKTGQNSSRERDRLDQNENNCVIMTYPNIQIIIGEISENAIHKSDNQLIENRIIVEYHYKHNDQDYQTR